MHPSLSNDLVLLEHRQRLADAQLQREQRARRSSGDEHAAHPPEPARRAPMRLALPTTPPLMLCAGLR
ncbi:hypothetical protein [Cellulomonas chengniuliangii]|uniref:Uncharacterized protein n=1 Tax=Cellulomonas chengniuliangii TaxID=2968084 RepID=A0ABY5KUU7_9CELL|nr:hypothetical protein [Cellulomonas chengniuliangii]MCC2308952.1 hypothetical protein [Cellulomonas chengniuliangii]MCC2319484.1 hypothetical protein [Cellulomonas chengniuliangii]UUI74312.1 hypothetical protein NP064_10885 [Cellulomonas chengniuliangii]